MRAGEGASLFAKLGGGKCLFARGQRSDLKLEEIRPLPNGDVYMRYRRA